MKKKQANPKQETVFWIVFLMLALAGCSPQSRHRLLSVFFTGVPPLEETQIPQQEETASLNRLDRQVTPSKSRFYSHPTWADGQCRPCHVTKSDFTVPGVTLKSSIEFRSGGGMPGKLTKPRNIICLQCHTDKSPLRALKDNLWLHNTTAQGNCLECHDPHQSRQPHILNRERRQVCFPCHDKGDFRTTPAHQTPKLCLECHNPHMGVNRNLLSSELRETKIPASTIPQGAELQQRGLAVKKIEIEMKK